MSRLPRGWRAAGWVAVLVGVAAALVALPPIEVRTPVAPVVIGLFALTVGIGAAIRGERKVGGYAIAAGLGGLVLGYLATRSSAENLDVVVVWGALFAAMLRYATPLVYASLGGLVSERSGVVNIGLEGMMLMGAFFSIWGTDVTGNWVLGLAIGITSGALIALLYAFFAITLRADQIVGGTAINFLAAGLTSYLYYKLYSGRGTPTDLSSVPNIRLGFLGHVPIFGGFVDDVFGNLNLMIWGAFVLVFVVWIVVFKTAVGLRIRSVGEHPRAADTVGINVFAIRYASVVISGMLAAAGGAVVAASVNSFTASMTGGRGFIALAALIFGNWRPFGATVACLLFGFSSALSVSLQEYSASLGNLFQTLPYVLTLVAVAGVIGRSTPPAADGKPYVKQ